LRHGAGKSCCGGGLELARILMMGMMSKDSDMQLRITQELRVILAKTSCSILYTPAGIGFHPDHLLVHNACQQVADDIQHFYYYDFPYCGYDILTRWRRWILYQRHQVQEVKLELTREQIDYRKRLVAIYDSQIEVCFGSHEKLDNAVANYQYERYLEVVADGGGDLETASATARVAASSQKQSPEAAARFLVCMLVLDALVSFVAVHFVRQDIDWDDFSPRAMRSCYLVIFMSFARVGCILLNMITSLKMLEWVCVISMCFAAVAFSFTAGVRCVLLFVYYGAQLALGYCEQLFVTLAKAPEEKLREGPMNVLMLSDYMPPQTHGISTHTHGLVTALRDQNCRVHVYTTTLGEDEPKDATFLTWSIVNPWNANSRLALVPSLRLMWAIIFNSWDIVHVVFPSLIPWPVLFAAWFVGHPIYVSQHVSESLGRVYTNACVYYMGLSTWVLWSGLPVWLFATINAAPTYGFIRTNFMLKRYSPERVAIVPSSVDDSRFHANGRDADRAALYDRLQLDIKDQSRPLWLLVSRLAKEKDIFELLQALEHHVQSKPAVLPLLVVVGDGPLRSELETWVQERDLPVRFLGFVPNKEVSCMYRACDVCVTNSVHETFGLTVIESLACGCPMVMPHCAVFDELYADVLSDWMYKKGDVADLAKALQVASTASSREYLATVRSNNAFNPNLCWSWRDAAVEQILQYKRCHKQTDTSWCYWRSNLIRLSVVSMTVILIVYGP